MPVAQSPAHYINSGKGCPSITESFPLGFLLVHKMLLSPLARHCQWCNPILGIVVVDWCRTGNRTKNRMGIRSCKSDGESDAESYV
jgi:hypothetical protein